MRLAGSATSAMRKPQIFRRAAIVKHEDQQYACFSITLPSLALTHTSQLKAFCDVLPVDPPPEPKKRKAAVVKGGGKKVKVEKREGSSDEEEEEIDWVVAWEAGVLKSYTVAKLKMFCEENGLKKGGNKGELVDRIDDHISEARGVME